MSKAKQATKNISLVNKLTNYLQQNPDVMENLPSGASYVMFDKNDKELNKLNNKILDSLVNEGTTVVKAKETNNDKAPWIFTSVAV